MVSLGAPEETAAMPIAAQAVGFCGRVVYNDDRNVEPESGDRRRDALENAGDALQAEAGSGACIYFARISRPRGIERVRVGVYGLYGRVRIFGAARRCRKAPADLKRTRPHDPAAQNTGNEAGGIRARRRDF